MNEAKNPHTDRFPYCEVRYWQNGVACGKLDDWTQARLESMRGYPSMTFERAEKERLETVIRILAIAFDCGKFARSREFNALLNNTSFGG